MCPIVNFTIRPEPEPDSMKVASQAQSKKLCGQDYVAHITHSHQAICRIDGKLFPNYTTFLLDISSLLKFL